MVEVLKEGKADNNTKGVFMKSIVFILFVVSSHYLLAGVSREGIWRDVSMILTRKM